MSAPATSASTASLRPSLVARLAAAGFGPAGIEGATVSWRAQCPACRQAGARRLSASVRVTATPAGTLVSCSRGCPSPTILRALDALDGWGVTP